MRSSDRPPDLEVLHRKGWYRLVAGPDFYGVLDARDGTLERFPETDEGLDAAEERFRDLRRLNRKRRWAVEPVLVRTVVAGALIWLIGGALSAVIFALPGPQRDLPFHVGQLLDAVGFRLTIGALAVLASLLLLRAGDRHDGAERHPAPRWGTGTRALVAVLVGGLLVWAAAGAALIFVPVFQGVPAPSDAEAFVELFPPSRAFEIVQGVSTTAFRIWVTALVLLGVAWARQVPGGM